MTTSNINNVYQRKTGEVVPLDNSGALIWPEKLVIAALKTADARALFLKYSNGPIPCT